MKKQYHILILLFILFFILSCSSTIYYSRSFGNKKKPLKVYKTDTSESKGFKLLNNLIKTKYAEPIKNYIQKNGNPDYFFIPYSAYTPYLIYINKNKCISYTKSGFLFFMKVYFSKEKEIPLDYYNYFSKDERTYLLNLLKQKKREQINEIKKKR